MNEKKIETDRINRLILVGNGFDLAHGLKTSYNDFIIWYLKQVLTKSLEEGVFQDDLLRISADPELFKYASRFKLSNVSLFVDHFYTIGLDKLSHNRIRFEGNNYDFFNPFSIVYDSSFFQELINTCTPLNWVDIENHYFKTLKKHFLDGDEEYEMEIKILNKQWETIIDYLEEYLQTISENVITNGYARIFYASFNANEFVDMFNEVETKIGDTLILNFNYTSTVDKYVNWKSPQKVDINHIHGKLGDKENRLIFGFGDELDDDYKKFEQHKAVGQFDYIKSFWYFKTGNYYELLRFIDSKEYQVYILGHSCGLSDRTMLNMVFEHNNCRSIKIFYHGNKDVNNYTAITQEISRHFTDKPQMRRRIVSLDKCERMPQFDD